VHNSVPCAVRSQCQQSIVKVTFCAAIPTKHIDQVGCRFKDSNVSMIFLASNINVFGTISTLIGSENAFFATISTLVSVKHPYNQEIKTSKMSNDGMNRRTQIKLAEQLLSIIKLHDSIPVTFCTVNKTAKYSSRVVISMHRTNSTWWMAAILKINRLLSLHLWLISPYHLAQ